ERVRMSERIQKYGGALHVPIFCNSISNEKSKEIKMSVHDMIKSGVYKKPVASSNSLTPDWQSLWDALRIDISIRKAATETIRQNFYNIIDMPNSTRIFNATEFFPYAVVFEENNGEGQSVNQGETRAGQFEAITHLIFAAGFTWTLLAELFDESLDMEKISDAVLIGANGLKDDRGITPITGFAYAGVQQTAAAVLAGANRQELLYLTLEDAIDDLGDRDDPITDRDIDASDLRILAHPFDARHIARVSSGLPSTNERVYNQISEISAVVGYDGETIRGRVKDTVYAGVTKGTAYLVKKNRYMNIGIKRNLVFESDLTPDVTTLAREKRSWYFVEGKQTTGIQYFIQEITLPTW
ncbi:hypothetical protein KAR91_68425, partial [Candidatus Pacearchaeota archaeon]|nr:hypothetical protein [Candidatus Pacearchaeota archaeon]